MVKIENKKKLLKKKSKKTKRKQPNEKVEKVKEVKEEQVEEHRNGRSYTVSIALPGSILDNAQSPELRTYLAGQIARAAVIFNVDEIVIFDESCGNAKDEGTGGDFSGVGVSKSNSSANIGFSNCNVQLARILQYLECPQYLRKSFFPKHHDLKYAGLLNPLDSPHHMRADQKAKYREGVVLDRPTKPNKGSFVDCGIDKSVQIDIKLTPNTRVTVQMLNEGGSDEDFKFLKGIAVSPTQPRVYDGIYWGYQVRLASSLTTAITECPFGGSYDVSIGTSERGKPVENFQIPNGSFKHLLVVFGGVNGLEVAVENDETLNEVENPQNLFDFYLNTCANQGSRTIRTEEAILVTLSALASKITQNTV